MERRSFSEERVGKRGHWVFRYPWEKYKEDCIELTTNKYSTAMVWGTFRGNTKGPLVALEGDAEANRRGMTAKSIILCNCARIYRRLIFIYDNFVYMCFRLKMNFRCVITPLHTVL